MAPSKVLLGALATCLIAIGIAAQTGTIHAPRPAGHPQVVMPQPPQPQIVGPAPPVPPAPSPAAAPVQSSGDGGDGEGD